VNETLESLAVLLGMPLTGTKRIIQAIKKVNIWELLGPRERR